MREKLGDYQKMRYRAQTLSPGAPTPFPAKNLSDYSELTPLNLKSATMPLEALGKVKPKLPKL